MVRYFFAWTPLVIVVGTAVILTIPYLALIALMIVAIVALTAVAWAIVAAPRMLIRAATRRWEGRNAGGPWTAGVPSRVNVGLQRTRPAQASVTALSAHPPSERNRLS